jgi:acyl dehydratase
MNESSSEEPAAQPTSLDGLDELRGLVGRRLGRSGWLVVDQALIDGFAILTRDEQWIHIDRALAADGPFGTTVAHGFLTLSLCSDLVSQSFVLHGVKMTVNYGVDRVRFPSPVPAGASVRATVDLASVDDVPGGVQAVLHTVVSVAGADKPSCVADIVVRYYV